MLKFFDYSETILPLLALLVFLRIKRKEQQVKLLLLYFSVSFIVMGIADYLADRGINNVAIYHCYSLFEVFLIVPLLEWYNKKNKHFVIVAISLYTFIWLLNLLFWEHYNEFNSNSSSIAAICILFFCLRHFLILVKTEGVLNFQKLPSFWLALAFLFYSSSSVLMLGTYKYMTSYIDLGVVEVWDIIQVLNILKYLLIIVASICFYRQTYQEHSS